jgi:hypothetical protein
MAVLPNENNRPPIGLGSGRYFGFSCSKCCCRPVVHSWGNAQRHLFPACAIANPNSVIGIDTPHSVTCPATQDCSPQYFVARQYRWLMFRTTGFSGVGVTADGKVHAWGRQRNVMPTPSPAFNTQQFPLWLVPVQLDINVGTGFYIYASLFEDSLGPSGMTVIDSDHNVYFGYLDAGQVAWVNYANRPAIAAEGIALLADDGTLWHQTGANANPQFDDNWVSRTGFVKSINLTNGGSGYGPSAPVVTVEGNAIADCVIANGAVVRVYIDDAGSGYTSPPNVSIAPPSSGTTATATAEIDNSGFVYLRPESRAGASGSYTLITADGTLCILKNQARLQPFSIVSSFVAGQAWSFSNASGDNSAAALGLLDDGRVAYVEIPSKGAAQSVTIVAEGDFVDGDFVLGASLPMPGSAWLIDRDGYLWGWGINSNFRLGDGTTTNRSTPVRIGSHKWLDVYRGVNLIGFPAIQYAIHDDAGCNVEAH